MKENWRGTDEHRSCRFDSYNRYYDACVVQVAGVFKRFHGSKLNSKREEGKVGGAKMNAMKAVARPDTL